MVVARGKGAVQYLEDVLREVKRRYKDPFIAIAGDFNQWKAEDAVCDFPDVREADVGHTRKDKCLDRIFTNFGRSGTESGTVPPLDVDPGHPGAPSDHRITFVRASLPRMRSFEWISYSYRRFSEESAKDFGAWLAHFDWAPQTVLNGSNAKAEFYQHAVTQAMER